MADDQAWDADDFDPEVPAKAAVSTDKWDGEDEDDDDVKDNWDEEDEEKTEGNGEPKATQVKKKKSLKERLAEKEERQKMEQAARKKALEEERLRKPRTPEEAAAERLRIQKEQEQADLALAMDAFGISNRELAGTVIDTMNPSSREDFESFENALKLKILTYEKSPHYTFLLDALFRDLSVSLDPDDLKKLGSMLNALSNEKSKLQKSTTKGKKKSKKATIQAGKGENLTEDLDDFGDVYDDFL